MIALMIAAFLSAFVPAITNAAPQETTRESVRVEASVVSGDKGTGYDWQNGEISAEAAFGALAFGLPFAVGMKIAKKKEPESKVITPKKFQREIKKIREDRKNADEKEANLQKKTLEQLGYYIENSA